MAKILVLDGLSAEGVEIFKREGFEVDVMPPQKPDELAAIIGDYDGLVVRSATKVTAEALANPGNLKVIGRAGAGTDNIDKAAATDKGIVVMNTPGGNTISTCEHTFALMLSLCRQVAPAHQSMMECRWDRKKFQGVEVCGKTLGIVGVGRIGGALAKRAQAFEMKVLAFDPLLTKLKADALGVELVELDALYERSDFISLHVPMTDKTRNMIAMDQMKKMKPTCRIINAARGGLVNEADLAEAIKTGVIAGAALDVYTAEPFENNPFIGVENIVTTPHLAASTDEAQLTVAVDIAIQMADYIKTGAIVNAVNVPSLDAETRAKLQPLLSLAEHLGQFQASYAQGRPSAIEVEYAGDMEVVDTYPVTMSVLVGYLRNQVDTVNMVSAPGLLKGHGIESSEKHSGGESDYSFEIGVTVTTDQGSFTVKGTLFNGNDPRFCSIDGIRMDAKPEGHMLICRNDDVPMIIGRVCSVIGEAGVNIANLTLGRAAKGGQALTVLNLDQALSTAVLEQIRQVPHVLEARQVSLPEG